MSDGIRCIMDDNALSKLLNRIREDFDKFAAVGVVQSSFGTHQITGPHDDGEGEYVRVGFILPDTAYVESEGTYMELQAFRIYREEV